MKSTRIRQKTAKPRSTKSKPRPLTEETISRIVHRMPGGPLGYCKGWGWLTLARAIERAHKIK